MACRKPADYLYGEHTADILIRAYGCTLDEAFKNAAIGTVEIMYDTSAVTPAKGVEVRLEHDDLEGLLFAWISEILYLFDGEKFAIGRHMDLEVGGDGPYVLAATLRGERYDVDKHRFKGLIVKAMTYNMMKIAKNEFWELQFVVDI
ncbi:archease [Thermoproteus tenax]|uniref:Protein archease n=1 Tax=Thermoproteus tenax (strain ATCC 35583 / DSM 2078 / JCM 9277 / NBRC 100435 / Kra 1) TaxID=768679 RepID=G4RKQ4_THETK|nr:archease [Thermoproteus tenax]CCC82149.1 SHS2 domain protein implicated in nucleic acid metabolism [Thermoproteus tenax Kra 1]